MTAAPEAPAAADSPPAPRPALESVRVREIDGDDALTSALAERFEGEPTIVVLADPTAEVARALVAAGARGVVGRDARPADLDAAATAVTHGYIVIDARAGASAAATDLTPREHDVLRLLADGGSNKSIAARLGLAENTVKFHVASILGKLGAATRTEAVTIGVRRGWIVI